jgi:hypothetical protein
MCTGSFVNGGGSLGSFAELFKSEGGAQGQDEK